MYPYVDCACTVSQYTYRSCTSYVSAYICLNTQIHIYIYARYKRIHTHIYTLKAIRTTRAHRQQLPVVHCVDAYSKASHAEPSVEVEGRLIRNGYGNI